MVNKELYDCNYGLTDPHLGDLVTVNGVSLYNLNADLIDYKPTSITITKDFIRTVGNNSYIINKLSVGDNGIVLRFYVGGTTYQQAQINCNKVLYEFKKDIVSVVISDTEFEYVGALSSFTINYTGVPHYYLLEVTMVAVKRLPPIVIDFDEGDGIDGVVIENSGVIDTGLLIAIKSNLESEETIVSLSQNNEIYYSMSFTNPNQWVYNVVDGMHGKVLCGTTPEGLFEDNISESFPTYQNNFANTILYDFPKLKDGESTLYVFGGVDKVIVKYYPLFFV